ncbi:MAG: haloacid dehalogenase-like hydrolase [Candidatus Magasanikbacteria bacterium]|nr:haloacid dehalogenase-like hydrolase [Candidatus Magasanikbacteria bacterium]
MSTAVVDFDKTLLTVDSTMRMLRDGYTYSSPIILWWGIVLFGVRFILPYQRQVFFRRKFRHALFKEVYRRGAARVTDEYAEKLFPFVNEDLVRYINEQYNRVYVSTAAWKDLVEAILARKNIKGWIVHGTEYDPDFNRFSTCWHMAKVDRLKTENLEHFDVFTDSEEDRPLMDAADRIFLVKGSNFSLLVQ